VPNPRGPAPKCEGENFFRGPPGVGKKFWCPLGGGPSTPHTHRVGCGGAKGGARGRGTAEGVATGGGARGGGTGGGGGRFSAG